ncbi:hypothetical protein TH53_09190 [Pedobacter lusitanus]|uniref:Uncharacterized protein n=1 Tax=Pedobacter lusitanus TaxID=1503925 RepID=A0A0D0F757_9SPHI|nr:hypothetical protein [Pedobacter lusitanus]KIO77443.1 hypothetical protein TH53_09190 [Pedobacter lusitanus]
MKKLLLAFAFAAAVLPVVAQTAAPAAAPKQQVAVKAPKVVQKVQVPAAQRAIPYSKELQQKLALNDAQYTKILAVNTECINKKDALKQADQQKGGGSKEIAQYRMEQYKTILTPDQLAKLKALNAAQGTKPKS